MLPWFTSPSLNRTEELQERSSEIIRRNYDSEIVERGINLIIGDGR